MNKYTLILLLFCQLFINRHSFAFTEKTIQKKDKAGQLVRQTNLHESAELRSDVLLVLEADKKITVKSRQRAWYLISSERFSEQSNGKVNHKSTNMPVYGWVSMLSVRFLAQAKREGELGFSAAFSSMSKGSLPTVSTGVRGFDDNDLKNAKANFKQVEHLNAYAISEEAAIEFARTAGLLNKDSVRK